MPKEDYLLKYLEKLSRIIAAMLALRQKGCSNDGLQLANETFKELLDQDVDDLLNLSDEAFVEAVRKQTYNASYLELLAQLAHQTAHSFSALLKPENANVFYEKALQLYYLLNEKDKTFSFERQQIITELECIVGK